MSQHGSDTADRIVVRGIRFRANCGVFPEERRLGVSFSVDVTVYLDLGRAAAEDTLADTVDYAQVARTVTDVAASRDRMLVECLAGDIAQALLKTPWVHRVAVAVTKPMPPVDAISGGITVHLERAQTP